MSLRKISQLAARVGIWTGGFAGLTALAVFNRLRRRDGMPAVAFKEADEEGGGYRFVVVEGAVCGVHAGGHVKLVCVEQAMRVLDSIPPEQIHRGDRCYLRTVVLFSRLPRGDRAHNTSGFPA